MPSSSRASVVLPLLTNSNPFAHRKVPEDACKPRDRSRRLKSSLILVFVGYGTSREDRQIGGGGNLGSDPSVCTPSSPDLPCSPLHRTSGRTHSSEDLYSWMAKQDAEPVLSGCMESKINTLQTESSGEEAMIKDQQSGPVSFYPLHDSLRLLDANLIFQPLLSSLGVMPQQLRLATVTESSKFSVRTNCFCLKKSLFADSGNDVTSLDALGSNLSLVGNMETMRIDIVVSEHGKTEKKKAKNKSKTRLFIDINTGTNKKRFVFVFFNKHVTIFLHEPVNYLFLLS